MTFPVKPLMITWIMGGIAAIIVMLAFVFYQLNRMETNQSLDRKNLPTVIFTSATASAEVAEPTPEPSPKSGRSVVVKPQENKGK